MDEEYEEVEIPTYFQCPISMNLMKDPVTVSTGITYDRRSIEKWLFHCNNTTCPVTKQPLTDPPDLTPNHTLRRLIQAWCTLNSLEKVPTPKPPVERSQILEILSEARKSPGSSLRRLRSIAGRDESSRNRLRDAGAVGFLVAVVRTSDDVVLRDEAASVLLEMELSDPDLRAFFEPGGGGDDVVAALVRVLENGNCRNRARAMSVLKSAFDVADPVHLIGSRPEVFVQAVHVLRDRISPQATKAALKLLMELCPWGRNRVKAVESGSVSALIELLLDHTADRRAYELALTVLDQLCSCAEGRAELLSHGAGLAIVSKKILRVSHAASDKGVRILGSISKYSGSSRVLQEMLQVGVVSKLCLVQQVEANRRTKERAKEILRLHSRVWKGSSCVPSHLLSSYPSS